MPADKSEYERGYDAGFRAGFESGREGHQQAWPYSGELAKKPTCGCPANGVCLNAACPHRPTVTC